MKKFSAVLVGLFMTLSCFANSNVFQFNSFGKVKFISAQSYICCITINKDKPVSYVCTKNGHTTVSRGLVTASVTKCADDCTLAFVAANSLIDATLNGMAQSWTIQKIQECNLAID